MRISTLINSSMASIMHPILRKLEGGDRRSIGRSDEVVAEALARPVLFKVLITGLSATDALLRMRAADALEKISVVQPDYLQPHKVFLIKMAAASAQKEVRWHLAQMLPRLKLNEKERRRVADIMLRYLSDGSSIVKTCAMQALADIAIQSLALRPSILLHLRELTVIGTPAMKARGRKLLAKLNPGKTR